MHTGSRFLPPPRRLRYYSHTLKHTESCLKTSRCYFSAFYARRSGNIITLQQHTRGKHSGPKCSPAVSSGLFAINIARVCLLLHTRACAGTKEGPEGTRGYEWGTCCGDRYVCGFIGGEVKGEGHSCWCRRGLIDASNKREEVKSRNWPCVTAIRVLQQSAVHLSPTVHMTNIANRRGSAAKTFRFCFPALALPTKDDQTQ